MRRVVLVRAAGPPAGKRPRERDWIDARGKVDAEGKCRFCGRRAEQGTKLDAAHVIGREHDQERRTIPNGVLWVNPAHVVPLCSGFDGDCHGRYDRREIDLLPVLTTEEQAEAVRLVGMMSAFRRITGDPLGG